jgi:hypothetical protein
MKGVGGLKLNRSKSKVFSQTDISQTEFHFYHFQVEKIIKKNSIIFKHVEDF